MIQIRQPQMSDSQMATEENSKMKRLSDILTPYANEMNDERLGTFLSLSIGRVLLKNNTLEINDNDLRHITDWLKAAIINDASWMSNVDEQSRPKKLMKFSSIEQIVKEADKAMSIANQKLGNVKISEGDEELIMELNDGYYVVRLLTPEALDKESAHMQHCIGNGAYDESLDDPDNVFLSLRDSAGKPHATLELDGNSIIQLQGKQNKIPQTEYLNLLIPLIVNQELTIDRLTDFHYIMHPERQKWYDIYRLPHNTTFNQNIIFPISRKPIHLPRNLTINGSLNVIRSNISSLPEGLHIEGSLYARHTNIRELPHDLYVKDTLSLVDTKIAHYAPGANTPKEIILEECAELKSIADNLNVERILSLADAHQFASLPKNLSVGQMLNLENTYISELPEDLKVGKYINIKNTMIQKIHANILKCPNIFAEECALEIIENNDEIIRLEKLNLQYSAMEKLPNKLNVDHIDIDGSNVKELPDDIQFKIMLISPNQLTSLPQNLNKNAKIFVAIEDGYKQFTVETYRKELEAVSTVNSNSKFSLN